MPEITMRYVSRYLSHDTIRITISTSLMLRLIDYLAKIKEAYKDKRPGSDQLVCFKTIIQHNQSIK